MELLNNKENLLYQSNLRLIKALKFSLKKLEEKIFIKRSLIGGLTDSIGELRKGGDPDSEQFGLELERIEERQKLIKLKRELKRLKELTQTDI